MGRLSQLGGAILGTAVALNAGEALSADLPKKGYLSQDVAELSQYRYAILDRVLIANEGDAPDVIKESIIKKELIRQESGQVFIYWELKFLGLDPISGEPIFEYIYPGRERECITADNFVDHFSVFSTGQTVVVLDREDQLDQVICPEPVVPPTKVIIIPPTPPEPVTAPLEYTPHAGKFADVEPSLVKNGVFLVPILTLDASAEVPAELSTAAYTTRSTHGGEKRTVYREYVLENYVPETGTLKVRDSGDASKCMETQTFKDQIIGNRTSYLLSEPGSPEMKDVACKEEVATTPVVETPVATTVEAGPKESKPWELPVRAGLSLGADVEETSPYSLGNAPALHLSAQTQPFAFPLELGLSGDFIFTGEGSGLEGVDLMVGGQPFKKVPVRAYLTIGDSFEARDRYKETTLDGAFSYGAKVDGDVYEFSLLHQAMAVNCHVNAQQHLYGGGGLSVWNVGGGCGLAWDYVVSGGGREAKEKVIKVEVPLDRIIVGQQAYSFAPGKPVEIKKFSKKDLEIAKGESDRLLGEVRKTLDAKNYKAAYTKFKELEALGLPIEDKVYGWTISALQQLGDVTELNRVVRQYALQNPEAARPTIEDIEKNYGAVELQVLTAIPKSVSLVPVVPPFDANQRIAIDFANSQIRTPGTYSIFLPKGDYTLLEEAIHITDSSQLVLVTIQGDFSKEAALVPAPLQVSSQSFTSDLFLSFGAEALTKPEDIRARAAFSKALLASYQSSDWEAAETAFVQMSEYRDAISYEEVFAAAVAAYHLGNIKDSYQRFLSAAELNKTPEVQGWIENIEKNYASVIITSKKKSPVLTTAGSPKNEEERLAIADAQTHLKKESGYNGLVPVSVAYEISGNRMEVKSLAEGHQTYSFTLAE